MKTRLGPLLATTLLCSQPLWAMGLRSFVALPVDKGGTVLRWQLQHHQSTSTTTLNAAYGLSASQTLLLGLPYRLSPSKSRQLGDLSLLYRHTLKQTDFTDGTHRIGLLAGAVLPSDNDRDGAVQAGASPPCIRGDMNGILMFCTRTG